MLEQMAKRLNNPVIRFIVSLMENMVKKQVKSLLSHSSEVEKVEYYILFISIFELFT